MDAPSQRALISVKGSAFHHPWSIAAAAAALGALLLTNVFAFASGSQSLWLIGSVLIADMLAVGVGVTAVARVVMLAEQRSGTSQAQLDAIVDSAMDAILTVDAAQNVVLYNRAAEKMFGVPRDQAIGSPLERFLPQRFRSAHRGHVEQFGRTGVTSRRMGEASTLWALRADGTEFAIEASISQAGEPGRPFYTVILRDITLRKEAQDALHAQQRELRRLSAQVLEAREEEKTLIARELHDELGQLLTALKMDLAWLRARLPRHDLDAAQRAEQMERVLDQTVGSARRISADLRPLMLDDLGLAEAANWLAGEFSGRSGVHCEIRMPAEGALDGLEKSVATAIYRGLQESLTNIARHAGASKAWVSVGTENGEVYFEVEDDGRGIEPVDLAKTRSLGLKGMRERVHYLGGSIEIGRAPRGGTRVRVRVPLQPAEQRETP
jgi:PAS domain S-box-containing protein